MSSDFYKSIVSMTISKTDYINTLEPAWDNLRKKYEIPDGYCLHFTEIKALLNPRHRQKAEVKTSVLGKIFITNGRMNFDLLESFYIDVLNIISSSNFKIVVTTKRFVTDKHYQKLVGDDYSYSPWYIIFKMHLNNLAFYMQELSHAHSQKVYQEKALKDKRAKMKYIVLPTKLRYDGDFGLTARNDLRNAYSHVITTGTQNFTPSFTTKCFDNLKFIDKLEVGNYKTCSTCNAPQISHAGNEIIDFIALYASNYFCASQRIQELQSERSYTEEEAKSYVEKSLNIRIGDKVIQPIESIKSKFFTPFC